MEYKSPIESKGVLVMRLMEVIDCKFRCTPFEVVEGHDLHTDEAPTPLIPCDAGIGLNHGLHEWVVMIRLIMTHGLNQIVSRKVVRARVMGQAHGYLKLAQSTVTNHFAVFREVGEESLGDGQIMLIIRGEDLGAGNPNSFGGGHVELKALIHYLPSAAFHHVVGSPVLIIVIIDVHHSKWISIKYRIGC
jgi:hypothetical protein